MGEHKEITRTAGVTIHFLSARRHGSIRLSIQFVALDRYNAVFNVLKKLEYFNELNLTSMNRKQGKQRCDLELVINTIKSEARLFIG